MKNDTERLAKLRTVKAKDQDLTPRPRGLIEDKIPRGMKIPGMYTAKGDGMSSEAEYKKNVKLQFSADNDPDGNHDESEPANYSNEVPLTGERAWLRGGGSGHRPTGFDAGPVHSKNPIKGEKNNAKDGDCTKSPFSAAANTYDED